DDERRCRLDAGRRLQRRRPPRPAARRLRSRAARARLSRQRRRRLSQPQRWRGLGGVRLRTAQRLGASDRDLGQRGGGRCLPPGNRGGDGFQRRLAQLGSGSWEFTSQYGDPKRPGLFYVFGNTVATWRNPNTFNTGYSTFAGSTVAVAQRPGSGVLIAADATTGELKRTLNAALEHPLWTIEPRATPRPPSDESNAIRQP